MQSHRQCITTRRWKKWQFEDKRVRSYLHDHLTDCWISMAIERALVALPVVLLVVVVVVVWASGQSSFGHCRRYINKNYFSSSAGPTPPTILTKLTSWGQFPTPVPAHTGEASSSERFTAVRISFLVIRRLYSFARLVASVRVACRQTRDRLLIPANLDLPSAPSHQTFAAPDSSPRSVLSTLRRGHR